MGADQGREVRSRVYVGHRAGVTRTAGESRGHRCRRQAQGPAGDCGPIQKPPEDPEGLGRGKSEHEILALCIVEINWQHKEQSGKGLQGPQASKERGAPERALQPEAAWRRRREGRWEAAKRQGLCRRRPSSGLKYLLRCPRAV